MFFGEEPGIELTFFGPWHLLQILLTIVVIYLIIRYKDNLRNYKHEKWIRYGAGITLLSLELSYNIWHIYNGTFDLFSFLPMGVCAINVWVSIYLMFSKNEKVFYIIYFWGLGAILSVLFPDILQGPDRYRYYQFFLSHQMFLWIYMYMIFVYGYRPTLKHFKVSAILLGVVAVGIALPLSYIFDHNFMFMYNAGGTPLEIIEPLGPVLYVIGTVIVIFLIMAIYYSPIYFFVIRKENKSKN